MPRRFLVFLIVGGLGFLVDAGVTMGLVAAGLSPFVARPPAIAAAAFFTWLANRRGTFAIQRRPSVGEVARYAAVASSAALLNYVLFAGLIALYAPTFVAIILATVVVAVFSYFGYKRFAFGMPSRQ